MLISLLVILHLLSPLYALFEGCDNRYTLNPNSVATVQSPNYPNKYSAGSSCRYTLAAPSGYEILAECTINIDKGSSGCTTEKFYISRDGQSNLAGADEFCGSGTTTRVSEFQTMVIAYISQATTAGVGGTFSCRLTTRPQACDCGWSLNSRIVGGVAASPQEFPSTVALYDKRSQQFFCGGTILNERTVVTAAHCTRLYTNPNDVDIVAGDNNLYSSADDNYRRVYSINRYVEHPNYNPTNNENDLALLITNSPMEWSRGIGPICLPFSQSSNNFDYTQVALAGWGTTSFAGSRSSSLQKAYVSIIPNSSCRTSYPNLVYSQECTYAPGKDACQFDSGGPVISQRPVRQFLLGVISFGNACGTGPGVNTRITSFLNWISTYSSGSLCNKPY